MVTFRTVQSSSLKLHKNSYFHAVLHTFETVEYSWSAFTKQHASTQCSFAKVVGLPSYTFWKQEHVKNVLQLATYLNFFQNEPNKGSKDLWMQ